MAPTNFNPPVMGPPQPDPAAAVLYVTPPQMGSQPPPNAGIGNYCMYPPPPQPMDPYAGNNPLTPIIYQQTPVVGGGVVHPPPTLPPPLLAEPVAVIGPEYCCPAYPVDLNILRKSFTLSEGNFGVTDVNGDPLFKVKGKLFSLRDRRVLYDALDAPLVTFQQKILSAHRRWQVFRGESTSSKDLLFSVKKSSLLQLMKTKLDVFLASNTKEDVCDFHIKGSYFESACVIYLGNSTTTLAQMHRKHTTKSILLGKDNFGVTVYPNVDYAFITALVVILEEINQDRNGED